MKNSNDQKLIKSLFKELPYHGLNIVTSHSQFNNLLRDSQLQTKRHLDKLHSLYDLDIFSLNTKQSTDINPDLQCFDKLRSNYYSPHSFSAFKKSVKKSFSILHCNIRSLQLHKEQLETHLLDELNFDFDILGISETKIKSSSLERNLNLNIPGYSFEFVPTPLASGGVGMYINKRLHYNVIERISDHAFQALWIEICFAGKKNAVCGIIYRQHNSPDSFLNYFNESLERYSGRNNVYIIGDFNIDLLKSETCNFSHSFLLSLQSCHFLPTIDKPTRVHRSSATLIDNIFTNNPEQLIFSGNIISDISDHFSQFCIISSPTKKYLNLKRKIRDFSNFSQTNFLNDLSDVDLSLNGDTDQMFNKFYRKFNKIVNKHAPLKNCSNRTMKRLSKPWITKGIRQSIKIKNKLLALGDRDRYKLYRNRILNITRLSKKLYFHSFFSDNIKNIKKTWQGINSIINNSKKIKKSILTLKDPSTNSVTCDKIKIPSILNKHFSSVGQKLASQIPDSNNSFTHYLGHIDQQKSFYFTPVTEQEIECEITMTPNNKSYGLYSFPVLLLKCAKHLISKPLAQILNTSVQNGKYPSKLKLSKVIPIYKSDDESDPNNYRPISLLSVFNRIFEKLMYNRLINFVEKLGLLDNAQYGFRSGSSTTHAILDILNTIQTNMDKKLFSCAIFIDLKKAFDTVNHDVLLKKLYFYGIRGITNSWFESYLSKRTQVTVMNDCISEKEYTPYGVPQGSVLGPLLFLLYINDITKASNKFNFFLFADDTNLLYANKNLKTLEKVVNEELIRVSDWLIANKLTLNIQKSNYVIFRPYQKKLTSKLQIKIFDNALGKFIDLTNKEYVKYLGILIDCHLSWKHQIDYISTKVSKTVGLIAKLRHFVPQDTLLTLYKSLIYPYLSYGICAWGQASKSLLNKLLILQKRALKFIFFNDKRDSAIPLFVKSKVLPLNLMYCQSIANLMHDVVNKNCPDNLFKMFSSVRDTHSYCTRSSTSDKLHIQASRLNVLLNSFSRLGARLWNAIPHSTRNKRKYHFKKLIKNALLSMTQTEESYIDVHKVIQILPNYLSCS